MSPSLEELLRRLINDVAELQLKTGQMEAHQKAIQFAFVAFARSLANSGAVAPENLAVALREVRASVPPQLAQRQDFQAWLSGLEKMMLTEGGGKPPPQSPKAH